MSGFIRATLSLIYLILLLIFPGCVPKWLPKLIRLTEEGYKCTHSQLNENCNLIQERHRKITRIAKAVHHKVMSHVPKGSSARPVWKSSWLFMTIVWSLDLFNPVSRNDSDNCWRSWLPCDPIRMLPCIKIWAARWIRPQKVTSVNWSRRSHQGLPSRATFAECLLTGSTKKQWTLNISNWDDLKFRDVKNFPYWICAQRK